LYGLDDHVLHIMHITGRFLVPVPCSGVTKGAASHWGLLWFAYSLDWEGLGLLWDPELRIGSYPEEVVSEFMFIFVSIRFYSRGSDSMSCNF